jgi:hypothetical protein
MLLDHLKERLGANPPRMLVDHMTAGIVAPRHDHMIGGECYRRKLN